MCLCLLAPSYSAAEQTSFERAVIIFNKGFKKCVEANATRSKNLNSAKKKYAQYESFKDRAVDIDKTILTSTERSLPKNIKYCEKVHTNLLKAEASPILEQALADCKMATNAFKDGNTEESKAHYTRYLETKEKALSITDTVLKVYALSSGVRQCERLERKVSRKAKKIKLEDKGNQALITLLARSVTSCKKSESYLRNKKIPMDSLKRVQKHLKDSRALRAAKRKYPDILALAEKEPNRENSKRITQLLSDSLICIEKMKVLVKKGKGKNDTALKSIQSGIGAAQTSLLKCQTALKNLKDPEIRISNLNHAIAPQGEAKKLLTALTKSDAYKNAERFPKWPTSVKLLDKVVKIRQCEIDVAESYTTTRDRIISNLTGVATPSARSQDKNRPSRYNQGYRDMNAEREKRRARASARRKAEARRTREDAAQDIGGWDDE